MSLRAHSGAGHLGEGKGQAERACVLAAVSTVCASADWNVNDSRAPKPPQRRQRSAPVAISTSALAVYPFPFRTTAWTHRSRLDGCWRVNV